MCAPTGRSNSLTADIVGSYYWYGNDALHAVAQCAVI